MSTAWADAALPFRLATASGLGASAALPVPTSRSIRMAFSRPPSSRPRAEHSSLSRSRPRSGRTSAKVAFFDAATASRRSSFFLRSATSSPNFSTTKASSSRESRVVRRHGKFGRGSFAPELRGGEMNGIQRTQRGGKWLRRSIEDRTGNFHYRQCGENPENGFASARQSIVRDALDNTQAVQGAQAFHLGQGTGDAFLH